MATISTGSTGRPRKPLSVDVPLVPFLDLLLCCVMFLLVTAVWNEPFALEATQRMPGPRGEPTEPPPLQALLSITCDGYTLSTTAGERVQVAARDTQTLLRMLVALRQLSERHLPLRVSPDDDVPYSDLVRVLDVTSAAGYRQVDVASPQD